MPKANAEEKILAGALTLPPQARAKLANRLLDSLDEPRPDIDEAWGRLAASRAEELKSGKVKGIPKKEAHRRFREHLKRMKAKCTR